MFRKTSQLKKIFFSAEDFFQKNWGRKKISKKIQKMNIMMLKIFDFFNQKITDEEAGPGILSLQISRIETLCSLPA